MTWNVIDNPADGHCGFYAMAIGLLDTMVQDDAVPPKVYRNWIALDPQVSSALDEFIANYKVAATHVEVQTADTHAPTVPTLSTPARILANIRQSNVRYADSPFAQICKNRSYALLKPLKNSLKTILNNYRLQELEELKKDDNWGSWFGRSRLYVDFAGLVNHDFDYQDLHNIFSQSRELREMAQQIRAKVLSETNVNLKRLKSECLIKQAFQLHFDIFQKSITNCYAPNYIWWATEQDLLDLATCFETEINFIRPNIPIRANYPCIYLENHVGLHWRTRVYPAEHRPDAFQEQDPAPERCVAEVRLNQRAYDFLSGSVEAGYLSAYYELTERLISSYLERPMEPLKIKDLNERKDVYIAYFELLKHHYDGQSRAYRDFHQECLAVHRELLAHLNEDIDSFRACIDASDTRLKQLKLRLYQDLLQEFPENSALPPSQISALPPSQISALPPSQIRMIRPELSKISNHNSNFWINSALGLGGAVLALNMIPGALAAVTMSTGLSVVAANLVVMLIGVYLVNLIRLVSQIWQDSMHHELGKDFPCPHKA